MADYSFGGNDDETAELKKFNAEVVFSTFSTSSESPVADLPFSLKMAIITKLGRNWFAQQNLSMEG
jgi:hypothetical protein